MHFLFVVYVVPSNLLMIYPACVTHGQRLAQSSGRLGAVEKWVTTQSHAAWHVRSRRHSKFCLWSRRLVCERAKTASQVSDSNRNAREGWSTASFAAGGSDQDNSRIPEIWAATMYAKPHSFVVVTLYVQLLYKSWGWILVVLWLGSLQWESLGGAVLRLYESQTNITEDVDVFYCFRCDRLQGRLRTFALSRRSGPHCSPGPVLKLNLKILWHS